MRNTKQKFLVYDVVSNSDKHFTAEEVYIECLKLQPNISLGTVYRNLNKLVELKKIKRIKMPNSVDRYDKNFIHGHAICIKCNKLTDIYEDCLINVPNIKKFKIIDYDLIFNGICEKCQKEEK